MKIKRVIRFFQKHNDDYVGEFEIKGIDLDVLIRMFGKQKNDPFYYECYPIRKSHIAILKRYVKQDIDIDKYEYFMETDAYKET